MQKFFPVPLGSVLIWSRNGGIMNDPNAARENEAEADPENPRTNAPDGIIFGVITT